MSRYPFKSDFEPVALPGENICILPERKFYRVKYVEPLPEIEKDFGAISASSTLSDQEVEEIYMPKNELAQYRVTLKTPGLKLKVKQPRGTGRFLTKKQQAVITDLTSGTNLTEIFQFEDTTFIVDVTNTTSSNLSESKVVFSGFRYVLEPLKEEPEKYTCVPVGGIRPPVVRA